jgi:23S rRNA (guanosine2251-2'-O)-methyltransferase
MRKPSKRSAPKKSAESPAFHRTTVGIHAVMEALRVHPTWAVELWLKEGFESHPQAKELLALAKKTAVRIQNKTQKQLDGLGSGHQGVALHLRQSPQLLENALKQQKVVCLALDQVTDPHNLGAILRSAWLFQAAAIYTPQDRSVSLTPTVCKVAQGGAEHVPVAAVSPLDQELKRLKEEGFWVFGLSHKADKTLFDLQLPEKVVWVLGAEGTGIRKPVERVCDELVSIPQASPAASFNVSVAAGLALAESYRQLFFSKASK